MAVISANYADFEATHYQIDFGGLSLRKALNIAETILRNRLDPKDWERDWQHYFETPEDRAIDLPFADTGKTIVLV